MRICVFWAITNERDHIDYLGPRHQPFDLLTPFFTLSRRFVWFTSAPFHVFMSNTQQQQQQTRRLFILFSKFLTTRNWHGAQLGASDKAFFFFFCSIIRE